MIVSVAPAAPTNHRLVETTEIADSLRWICLARRGMLHSECEAVDLVVLGPGTTLDRRGRDGVGEVWFVFEGLAVTGDGAELAPGAALVIEPGDTTTTITARAETRLLTLSVLAEETVAALAPRRPDLLPR